jgi:hypothetical protein
MVEQTDSAASGVASAAAYVRRVFDRFPSGVAIWHAPALEGEPGTRGPGVLVACADPGEMNTADRDSETDSFGP